MNPEGFPWVGGALIAASLVWFARWVLERAVEGFTAQINKPVIARIDQMEEKYEALLLRVANLEKEGV